MTDDELSEFAEMLADACERSLTPVSGSRWGEGFTCPLGAACGLARRVSPETARLRLRIPFDFANTFAFAFDGFRCQAQHPYAREPGFVLGKLFRELYP